MRVPLDAIFFFSSVLINIASFSFVTNRLSCQVVLRGTRSAGYGFVAVTSTEVAQKAVEALNGKDLEGRAAIVEVAKPAEQKAQEKSERKAKRRVSRRGSKPVPGEVTEAEANGEAEKPSATTDGEGDVAKPKKKKKNVVSVSLNDSHVELRLFIFISAQAQEQGQERDHRREW